MKYLFYLLLCVVLCISCSQKTEIEKINITIPEELKNNTELVNFVNSYTKTANEFNQISNDLIKTTSTKNFDQENLSNIQKIKFAKTALKVSSLSFKIENYKKQQEQISQKLNPSELNLFIDICKNIELQMVQVDRNSIGLSDEELLAQQKKQEAKDAEIAKLQAEFDKAQMELPEEQRLINNSEASQNNQEFKWWHLLFPLLVIGMIAFIKIRQLRQVKDRVLGYKDAIKDFRGTTQSHISNSKRIIKDKENQMTDEQKEDVNKLFDVLDNISKK